MKKINIVFFLIGISVILSCGSDKKDTVSGQEAGKETHLYVRFMEKERNVKASAEFKVISENKIRIPDTIPYKIWFQGRTMEYLQEFTGKNMHNLELEYALPGVFEFTIEDTNGKAENFSFDLNSREAPTVESFTKQGGLVINLGGIKLDERDGIVVVVTDQMAASASSIVNGPGGGNLIFNPSAFEKLKEGPVDLYLVFKSSSIDTLPSGRTLIKEKEYFFKEISAELQ
jgi:hypothetical protein